MHSDTLSLSPQEKEYLAKFGFEAQVLLQLRHDLLAGKFTPERNRLTVPVAAPAQAQMPHLPERGSREALACEEVGNEAIAKGHVGAIILNGGMATRFGGKVKGIVEVLDGQSFLGLKLRDIRAAKGPVTTFLMNSFATNADTLAHLQERRHFGLDGIKIVTQSISIRLTPEGDIFRDANHHASFYAPGHGDLFNVFADAPEFVAFKKRGGRYLAVSNVDNLAATLSPRVIGAHIMSGKPVTVEVVPRYAGDKGGAPAVVNGRLEVVEGFRFPTSFDIESIPVFNTNTFVMNASAIMRHPLTWFRADKEVEGRSIVQFEQLLGEITASVDAMYLQVPREGVEGRFLPVKTPADLHGILPIVRDLFAGM